MSETRTIKDIQDKLASGEAVVMTASELCDKIRAGENVTFDDVHVVTASTCGLMSGTYAVLSFKFCGPNKFKRAKRVWLNGVEANPGPCPNERIGILDLIVQGTNHSTSIPHYGGGHLFADIIAHNRIHVLVETDEGEKMEGSTDIDQMQHAVLHGTRHAFRNYVGFVNPSPTPVSTIFCSEPFPPNLEGATACGCGELNPIQKDPGFETIGVGTRFLLNGSEGYITGSGTRSSEARMNMTAYADMKKMDPNLMGGFKTSSGPEVIQTWAVPIPVLNQKVMETLKVLDEKVPLTITDVKGRIPIGETTYADLWQGTAKGIGFDQKACLSYLHNCKDCPPAQLCPTEAFTLARDGIDPVKCFHCGLCKATCYGDCFSGELGKVTFDGKEVPIVQRLSDRVKAEKAAKDLKAKLMDGSFRLSEPVDLIEP